MEYGYHITKREIEVASKEGSFIHGSDFDLVPYDLDGTGIAKWLISKGFEIEKHYDANTNGLAITKCGVKLSTNGYCCRLTKR